MVGFEPPGLKSGARRSPELFECPGLFEVRGSSEAVREDRAGADEGRRLNGAGAERGGV